MNCHGFHGRCISSLANTPRTTFSAPPRMLGTLYPCLSMASSSPSYNKADNSPTTIRGLSHLNAWFRVFDSAVAPTINTPPTRPRSPPSFLPCVLLTTRWCLPMATNGSRPTPVVPAATTAVGAPEVHLPRGVLDTVHQARPRPSLDTLLRGVPLRPPR